MEERYPSEFKVNWHPSSDARPALGKAGEYVVTHKVAHKVEPCIYSLL